MSSAHPVTPLASLGLPRLDRQSAALLATPGLELSFNARGALLAAFTEIARQGRRKVLLPAFHCPSAITPALMAGLQPVYYRIRRDLSIDIDDVLAKADGDTAALLVIHFFGFAPSLAALTPLAQRGIRLIEDCSHAYVAADTLQLAGSPESDYRIYSFWKIAPSGVGGGLWRRDPAASPMAPRHPAPASARLRNYKMLLEDTAHQSDHRLLRALLHTLDGARNAFKPAYAPSGGAPPSLEHGELHYPVHPSLAGSQMPGHVHRIIAAADIGAISLRRRENFMAYGQVMHRLAPMVPLTTDLQDACCPWVYPVLLENRSQWDHRLRAGGVGLHTFGIYLHSSLFESKDSPAIADARFLANHVLCLSIHQDLSPADVQHNCHVITDTFKSHVPPCQSA